MKPFFDERGMTTTGMVLALLVTLSLIFTSGQVLRVQSASSEAQAVADAAALAAESQVGEYVIVARVCDAVVLSMGLTSLALTGIGVVCLCVPPVAGTGEALLAQAKQVAQARNTFANNAQEGLNKLQKLLPYLACANAALVAKANNMAGSDYLALAVLVPFSADDVVIEQASEVDDAQDEAAEKAQDIKEKAKEAEEAAQTANEWKQKAFEHDCGAAPGYCMEERAGALAGLTGAANPHYSSVDSWDFSVALTRAKAYYPARLNTEAPNGTSVLEQGKSQLRKRFYEYQITQLQSAYVHETADSFEANLPVLPRNTAQVRQTLLYTEEVYPRTEDGESFSVHAWAGCPNAVGGSLTSASACETEGFKTCELCQFSEQSLGSVAEASTSIQNGFEYHWRQVAEAAQQYQAARAKVGPLKDEVEQSAQGVFDKIKQALSQVAGKRIEVAPPGKDGAVAFVANVGQVAASVGFESGFVNGGGSLGARAAISAATLVEDPSSEGENVISSLLDNYKERGGAAIGAAGVALDCWSGLLGAYAAGQDALGSTVEAALNSLSLVGASGLGTWAKGALDSVVCACGLQPANLSAVKPTLVNSAHVASKDSTGFGARLLSVKQQAVANPLYSNDLFGSLISLAEQGLVSMVDPASGKVEVARIELFDGEISIPIEIGIPEAVSSTATSAIRGMAESLRGLAASITGVRVWQ